MRISRKQLQQPVELTCRRVVLDLLENAAKQRQRLGRADDPESLHAFRVSIRRLRTYLGTYGPHLPKALRKKLRKQLGELTEATNKGRDDEVHILWLERQLERRVPQLTRDGLNLVLEELTSHQGLRSEEVDGVASRFEKLEVKAREQFQVTQQAVRVDSEGRTLSYASSTGRVVGEEAEALRTLLSEITAPGNRKAAHRARLAAKRLRYVIEPVRPLVAGGTRVIRKLKQLQDMLGELRDAQNLERAVRSKLERAVLDWSDALAGSPVGQAPASSVRRHTKQERACRALAAAIQRVRKDQDRLYRRLERAWLHDSSLAFFIQVEDIVEELRSGRRRRLPMETAAADSSSEPERQGADADAEVDDSGDTESGRAPAPPRASSREAVRAGTR